MHACHAGVKDWRGIGKGKGHTKLCPYITENPYILQSKYSLYMDYVCTTSGVELLNRELLSLQASTAGRLLKVPLCKIQMRAHNYVYTTTQHRIAGVVCLMCQ